MLSYFRFLLKHPRQRQSQPRGFTLIELLVAIILAALIITPVLGFMINFLQTDRREQAKTTSEQEIQSALDYIAQDLKQSVYIYDEDGLEGTGENGIQDDLAPLFTGGNSCDGSMCQPILALWKRRYLDAEDIVNGSTVGSVNDGNGAFVYSLVVYSLVDADEDEEVWSDAARIVRYEMRDDVNNGAIPENPIGFEPFDLTESGSLKAIMNKWSSPGGSPTGNTLIDYIDEPGSSTPKVTCKGSEQRIPASEDINGFVVCVNPSDPNQPESSAPSARVYLRGNALKRVPTLKDKDYEEQYSSFFPTSSTQVKGNGFLYTQK
jgi:prepilin-type N-terminal cleavage/methylation domain-containing protein